MRTMARLSAGLCACSCLLLGSLLPAHGKLVEKILFSAGKYDHCPGSVSTDTTVIYTMNPDGSDVTALIDDGSLNHDPAVSPDGRSIAFISNRKNPNPDRPGAFIFTDHLYIMNSDGSNVRQLTFGMTSASTPCFSSNGRWLVFSMTPLKANGATFGEHDLYLVHTDGAGLKQITTDPHDDTCPVLAPEGQAIIFSSARAINPARFAIFAMTPNGTTTLLSGKYTGNDPAINPAGNLIAFQGQYRADCPLFLMGSNGNGLHRINGQGSYELPSFSPDGQRLVALNGSQIAEMDAIVSMRLDGTEQRILFRKPDYRPCGRAVWTQIAMPQQNGSQ